MNQVSANCTFKRTKFRNPTQFGFRVDTNCRKGEKWFVNYDFNYGRDFLTRANRIDSLQHRGNYSIRSRGRKLVSSGLIARRPFVQRARLAFRFCQSSPIVNMINRRAARRARKFIKSRTLGRRVFTIDRWRNTKDSPQIDVINYE